MEINRVKSCCTILLLLFCSALIFSNCVTGTKQLVSMGGEADLGKRLVQERKYDEAIVELERVIASHPHIDGKPWYWLGVARFHKGLYPQAAQALERAFVAGTAVTGKGIEIPLRESAFDILGWAYHRAGEDAKALQAFENGLKWSPRAYRPGVRWDILAGMGWAKYSMGDFHGSQQAFNQAISVTPGREAQSLQGCYRGLAFVNLALGNDDAALASIEKAGASQSYDKNFDLALIYLVQGRKEEAFRHWGGAGSAGVFIRDYQEGGIAGARIIRIARNEPAEAAGLMPGDIIRALDGQPVTKGSDFIARIKGFEPGKSVKIDLLRNNGSLQKTLTVGSAEALMAKHPLIAPVVKVRPIAIASTAPPAPPPQDQPAVQPLAERPSSDQPVPSPPPGPSASPQPVNQEPVVSIDALSVMPQEVAGGELFEVTVALYAENPQDKASRIAVTLHYSISRDGKVLKEFDPETFRVPNGETETITKKIRAGKTKGTYSVDIRFELEGQKAEQSAAFRIK